MGTYTDFEKFLLAYNFTGNASGTSDAFGNLSPPGMQREAKITWA